ncbi:MAG: SsrA-binding protein SmpB [Oligoflexia bacterium]|nr:SsrA-binding protein SmpB [Oligoflexia bacterium]
MKSEGRKIIATNKDARFRYFIEDTFEAGLVLTGTEVKSLRTGKAQLSDAYVFIKDGEAFLSNAHIEEYTHGNRENHNPLRIRKLLLNKKEIEQISAAVNEKGKTVVPTQMYFTKGKAKVEIGIGKGKKLHDKRDSIKERDSKREMDRARKR